MITIWRWAIVGGGVGIYVFGLGLFLGGVVMALNQYDKAVRQSYAPLVQAEEKAPASPEASDSPWVAHIRRVDEALAAKNTSAAELAWHEAYVAALRSRRWEGLVEVGDAYLRVGGVAGGRRASEPKARRIYLAALFRARQDGSLEGVLRATEAFATLGDREVAAQGVRMAEHLAAQARDAQGRERVRAFRARLAAQSVAAEDIDFDSF